jgi:competence ComEA-like helix-hairpin-helix protein
MADDPAGLHSDNAEERDNARVAGAFGFSRPEIIVLSAVAVIVVAVSAMQWMQRREAANVPAWTVEDILIDTMQVKAAMAATPSDQSGSDRPDYTTIDVNIASRSELMRLPGIGAVLADRIIAARERNGPFTNLIDLQRVNGIGPRKAAALAGWVRFTQSAEPK